MSTKRRIRSWAVMVVLSAGMVFQMLPSGCLDYALIQSISAFDICSVVNCTGGQYFDFCSPVPMFEDCPNFEATTTEP